MFLLATPSRSPSHRDDPQFFIPAFAKRDAVPGQYRTMFSTDAAGRIPPVLRRVLRHDHSKMIGRVVMEDLDYQNWLGGYTAETPVQAGKNFSLTRLRQLHESGRRQRCPTLGGLYGTEVPLVGGAKAIFDETYIRESILDPKAKVAAGYEPLMPTFRGQVTEEQMLALIAYIKSLSPNQAVPQRSTR
jgi:cytochrome c oxidase subunit 2